MIEPGLTNGVDEQRVIENEFRKFLYRMETVEPDLVSYVGMLCLRDWLNGHICISLSDLLKDSFVQDRSGNVLQNLISTLMNSDLVGSPGEFLPLIMENDNLYLHKYWSYEQELANWISEKSKITNAISEAFIDQVNEQFGDERTVNWQRVAVKLSLIKDLVIISGGPGTGKTYTVRRIIEILSEVKGGALSIALAAPTGKAAQRLNDSLIDNNHQFEIPEAVTLHKLLGARGDSGTFRFNSRNKLPNDIVIVDEASMLDITMWINLIRALREDSKLILLGDKNQLASVEAGSILGDICFEADNSFSDKIQSFLKEEINRSTDKPPINDCIIHLNKSYRFDENSGIKKLADAINSGDAELVLDLLRSNEYPEITYLEGTSQDMQTLITDYVVNPFLNKDEERQTHQILCALRKGPFGVEYINDVAEKELKRTIRIPSVQTWFSGRPIIVTRNNSVLKIRNGETGIAREEEGSGFQILFDNAQTSPVSVTRLQNVETSYAITVHKSQGSEYENVAILLSNVQNRVLTKELLYTSVTRARQNLLVIGSDNIIKTTVRENIKRNSGLRSKIWYG